MSVIRPPMLAGPIDRQGTSFSHCDSSFMLTGTGSFFGSAFGSCCSSSTSVSPVDDCLRAFMSVASCCSAFSIASSRLPVSSADFFLRFFFLLFGFLSWISATGFLSSPSSARQTPRSATSTLAQNATTQPNNQSRRQLDFNENTTYPPGK